MTTPITGAVMGRFLSAVRMVGKTCSGFYCEMVEHEEGGEVAQLGRAD